MLSKLPTIRVFWVKDGLIHQKLEEFVCTAIPHVGDHIAVQTESWEVLKVLWCIDRTDVSYVDVYVVEP